MSDDLRVLCVDDEPDVVDLAVDVLEREIEGLTAVTATSVAAGLEVVADGTVDCVVSDHEMPETSGLEFLRRVREDHSKLPFILFTGRGSEEIASEAISAGVTDYIQKTGREQYELLANRVEHAVTERRVEAELEGTKAKMERLLDGAADLMAATEGDEICDLGLAAAEEILAFDTCGVYEVEEGRFVPRGERSFRPDGPLPTVEDGVLGRTYIEGKSFLVEDARDHPHADPDSESLRSAISVPIGDFGVFQAIAERPEAFSSTDTELAELLFSHVTQALARVEYEEELRTTNEQLRTILANTTANIYIKDLEGRYLLVNERFREVLGKPEREILGRTDHEIQPAEIAEMVRANDREAIEREAPIEVEEEAEWESGTRTYYSVKVPLFDEDGDPRGVCGISSDITELKRRERELEQQTERLEEFASVVSHDLRNPLSVADGYLEMARRDHDDFRLGEVARAHERMNDIIEGLLELARGGERIGERREAPLAEICRRAWTNVRTEAATLSVEVDRTVDVDSSRLQQAFENLFRNAIEHAGEDVTVRVGATDEGFYVADDGPGVPENRRSEVLEPGVSTAEDGTGFGLAIVDDVIAAHGWTLRVGESESGGARFDVDVS